MLGRKLDQEQAEQGAQWGEDADDHVDQQYLAAPDAPHAQRGGRGDTLRDVMEGDGEGEQRA